MGLDDWGTELSLELAEEVCRFKTTFLLPRVNTSSGRAKCTNQYWFLEMPKFAPKFSKGSPPEKDECL